MSEGALRKGANVTISRGKTVIIQGSNVVQTQQEGDNTGRLALSGVYMRYTCIEDNPACVLT